MANAGLPVRLSFPKGEHADVIVQPGELTIGSAPDNIVVLAADGMQPHHASIVVDQRGFTLFVRGAEAWTHVNARPVREKAILRLGDVISLDSINIVLKPDHDASITAVAQPPSAPAADAVADPDDPARYGPPKAVLRGVSGPYFGKVIGVNGKLVIGRGSDCDLVLDEPEMSPQHAQIELGQSELFLRDLGSANGTLINGVQVRDASLFTGDQIAFDRNRFLIEAPGMPVRRITIDPAATGAVEPVRGQPQVTQTMRAIRIEPAAAVDPPVQPAPPVAQWNPWWLIAAGALIAVGIALLLLGLR